MIDWIVLYIYQGLILFPFILVMKIAGYMCIHQLMTLFEVNK